MVKHVERLDAAFAALADPTRRAILARLARGPSQPTMLAAPFDVSLPAISKHLRVLEQAGLITRRKEGRTQQCTYEPAAVRAALAWLNENQTIWEKQLDRLGTHLDEQRKKEETTWRPQERRPSRSGSPAPTRTRRTKSSRPGRKHRR